MNPKTWVWSPPVKRTLCVITGEFLSLPVSLFHTPKMGKLVMLSHSMPLKANDELVGITQNIVLR